MRNNRHMISEMHSLAVLRTHRGYHVFMQHVYSRGLGPCNTLSNSISHMQIHEAILEKQLFETYSLTNASKSRKGK